MKNIFKLPPLIIFYGGTGQAKVTRPIIEYYGSRLLAVFDDTEGLIPPFKDVPLFKGDYIEEWLIKKNRDEIGFSITIGPPYGRERLKLHERFVSERLKPVTIIHPAAWIDDNSEIGEGSQILAGAIVTSETKIGRQCIINTNASLDHEVVLDDGVDISPGATLCGLVHVGINAWICAGATVLPRITIGKDAIVGAGAVVTKDVPDNITVVGVPAKSIIRNREVLD